MNTDRSSSGRRLVIVLRALVLASLGVGPLVPGGCASGEKDELARLNSDNARLRDENSQKQRELEELRAARAGAPAAAYEGNPTAGADEFGPNTKTTRGGGEIVVEIAGDVLFDSGSIVLKASSKSTLNRVAGIIKDRYSSNHIRVEGYTDSDPIKKTIGKYDSNEDLSAKRALAVEKHLVSRGLPADMIYSAAFGPANPKGTKKASRRVEIVILGAN
jgi:chemotaxis protein MotB